MINTVEFTKRLEQILDYYGLSASAFADQIEFNRSSISHLLSGRNKPSLDFVLKVLKTFPEVELHWLLNGKGTFPKNDDEVNQKPEPHSPTQNTNTEELPHQKEEKQAPENIPQNTAEIERIVFFYKDGTFKVFNNLP